MTRNEEIRVKIERARISEADGMGRDAFMHLLEAVEMLATAEGYTPEKSEALWGPRSAAPSCARCKNDEHDKCGGPESGCGCAAENHGEPIQLRPADPPLPSGPPIVNFDAKSKGELYSQIAKVTGRLEGNVERDFDSLFDRACTGDGSMHDLCGLAEAALRLAGMIR